MIEYNCQVITDTIKSFPGLKHRTDLALQKYKPNDGIAAMSEFAEATKYYDLYLRLGKENYNYFAETIGSVEELEKRVIKIQVGGESEDQIREKLSKKPRRYIAQSDLLERIFGSDSFANTREKAEEASIIFLKLSELSGLEEHVIRPIEDFLESAEKRNLELCSVETSLQLLFEAEKYPINEGLGNYFVLFAKGFDNAVASECFNLKQDMGNKNFWSLHHDSIESQGIASTSNYAAFVVPPRRKK
jgi:hypothetical protein